MEGAEGGITLGEEPVNSIGAGDSGKGTTWVIISVVVGDTGGKCGDDEQGHHGDYGDELHREEERASKKRGEK